MAKLIQAFATYGPRIDLKKAADSQAYMEKITNRTTLSSGVVKNVQESEVETLIELLSDARPVHSGVAIFTPIIDAQGNVKVSVRVDKRILRVLNASKAFSGMIKNRANIGLTREQYIAMWNREHPEDPILAQSRKPFAQSLSLCLFPEKEAARATRQPPMCGWKSLP